ncbi:hypothetical protein CASFOL_034254 [Castilleja foliolosa]|uniref:VWFA domain-containing protein n=1 Tax=Castilleja foliolosa TaxID=1961234 RepID=A0ABD3BX40_9LAMI
MSSSKKADHDGTLPFSDDDEPLPAGKQNFSISAVPEFDAVAASETKDNFGVLVSLRAPSLSDNACRAPIDLVMVLDVSGSMNKASKLDLVKRASSFVIDHLGHSDRLSIVSFDTRALRILSLRRMTEKGRDDAKRIVDSLSAKPNAGTNILDGLTKGVQVLQERRKQNPVASMLFLSDGHDTCNNLKSKQPSEYLPASIVRGTDKGHQTFPVHTFGFGVNHDPLVMHAIADLSGGTFSFIESYDSVQDAFMRHIGGLLSIVVRDLRLTLRSASDGVGIKSIPSGKHASERSNQESRGTVDVGDLYADEEKEFLVSVSVPVYVSNGNVRTTPLLDITCSYIDELSNTMIEMESVEIRRPGVPLPSDVKVKVEVDRQKNRLDAGEGLAEAQRVAETGDLEGARAILSKKISSVRASASGQVGDDLCLQLEAEMRETEEKMGCKETYERVGRAYALSSMSGHANQRATSSKNAYVTPNMVNMVNKAQQLIKIEDVKTEEI